ncbi:hypothetical protein HNR23_001699 [Nocardiopsis mwathae]|uniref:DUF4180 domain-containing protein n=1 Tax=Nocardiopsis mwathae TaxID=1472723 RepID=A0A7W9YGC1_9ACTN|nr:DUF4180 domain-containing protein [Nocardiopsis mwathae]MBB6171639.1 hypothetical protein [Nocardiopsis mwathae]
MTSTLPTGPHDAPVVLYTPDGRELSSADAALDLIGEAWACRAEVLVVPVEQVADAFFVLKSGLAGEIVQKFVNYGLRLVILGDVSPHVADSPALRDFVREANRGRQVWFVETQEELDERLHRGNPPNIRER